MSTTEKQPFAYDKSAWGDGPWRNEPDRVEFEHAGLPCLLLRNRMGAWCGYAAVPPGHPLHGQHYDSEGVNILAHGGLTYASACQGDICHVPKPGEPDDVWWFGFDCAHSGDFTPSTNQLHGAYPWPETPYDHARAVAAHDWRVEVYRTVDYVRDETKRLAEQLAAVASEESSTTPHPSA